MAQRLREAPLLRSGLSCNLARQTRADVGGETVSVGAMPTPEWLMVRARLRVDRSACQGGARERRGADNDPVARLLGGARASPAIPRGGELQHLDVSRACGDAWFARQQTPNSLSRGRTLTATTDVVRRLAGIGNVQSCGRVVYVKGVTTRTNFRCLPLRGAGRGTSSRRPSAGVGHLSGVHRRRPQRVTIASNLERIGAVAPSLTRHVVIDPLDAASPTEAQHVVAPS